MIGTSNCFTMQMYEVSSRRSEVRIQKSEIRGWENSAMQGVFLTSDFEHQTSYLAFFLIFTANNRHVQSFVIDRGIYNAGRL